MTTDMQREALAVLAELWALSPDVRLGQLFAHLGFLGEAHLGRGLGYIEDDELMAVMVRHRAELLSRLQGAGDPETQSQRQLGTLKGTVRYMAPDFDAPLEEFKE